MAFSICHLAFAHQDLDTFSHTDIDNFLGYYYHGATFADSYVISKESYNHPTRDEFHFLYPYSLQPDDLFFAFKNFFNSKKWDFDNPIDKAFYLGYVCHLLTDAAYSMTLFRKYFGKQGIFPSSIVHHDVFRFELDCQFTDIHKNKSIADQASSIDISKLTKFFPDYIHQEWIKVIPSQIMLMPSRLDCFHHFIGDKNRFQQDLKHYDSALKDIKSKIDPVDITSFKETTEKLLQLAKAELFNPHSVYTVNDLENYNFN